MKSMLLIFGFNLLLFLYPAYSAIVYTDVSPDTVLVTQPQMMPGIFDIDINHDGKNEYTMFHHNIVQFFNNYNDCYVLMKFEGEQREPAILNQGDSINSKTTTWYNQTGLSMNMENWWIGKLDKYMGLKFKSKGNWYYGWLRISVPADGNSVIIKDFAYDNAPGNGVKAGEIISDVKENNNDADEISIFPNPAQNSIYLRGLYNGVTVRIVNMPGEELIVQRANSDKMEIDISSLPVGIYFIDTGNKLRSFVKIR